MASNLDRRIGKLEASLPPSPEDEAEREEQMQALRRMLSVATRNELDEFKKAVCDEADCERIGVKRLLSIFEFRLSLAEDWAKRIAAADPEAMEEIATLHANFPDNRKWHHPVTDDQFAWANFIWRDHSHLWMSLRKADLGDFNYDFSRLNERDAEELPNLLAKGELGAERFRRSQVVTGHNGDAG